MSFDGVHLLCSDGSSSISFVDVESLEVVKTISVTEQDGMPVDFINELVRSVQFLGRPSSLMIDLMRPQEYINGFLYANRLFSNFILIIDIDSGWCNFAVFPFSFARSNSCC